MAARLDGDGLDVDSIVDETNFAIAHEATRGGPPRSSLNGFVDRDGRQWVRMLTAKPGTPVHEAIHHYAEHLIGIVGEDVAAAVYFDGEVDRLKDAFLSETTLPDAGWESMIADNSTVPRPPGGDRPDRGLHRR